MTDFKVGDIVSNKEGKVLRVVTVIKNPEGKVVDYDLIDAFAPNRKKRRS